MSFARQALGVLPCLGALALLGCPIDDRELKLADDGGSGGGGAGSNGGRGGSGGAGTGGHRAGSSGSAGLGGGGSSGGTPPQATGGTGGGGSDAGGNGGTAAGNGPELVEGCVDLDGNGVGDCKETLLQNADFKSDVENWLVGASPQITWSELNPALDVPSGSAAVSFVSEASDEDGVIGAAAAQCLRVEGDAKLELAGNAFIGPDQGEGLATISAWSFETDDCSGARLDAFDLAHSQTGLWLTLRGEPTLPPATRSLLVRLGVTKAVRAATFQVLFDNVLVRKQ
jgi:hypothetical protein